MAYATDTRNHGASLGERFTGLFNSMADRFAKFKVYRATLAELTVLSDRDLNDLGISRASIRTIAIEHAYKAD